VFKTSLLCLVISFFCFIGACSINTAHADPPVPSWQLEPRTDETRGSLPSELAPWRQPEWVPYRDLLITRCLNPGPENNTEDLLACVDALQRLANLYTGVAAILEATSEPKAKPKPPPTTQLGRDFRLYPFRQEGE